MLGKDLPWAVGSPAPEAGNARARVVVYICGGTRRPRSRLLAPSPASTFQTHNLLVCFFFNLYDIRVAQFDGGQTTPRDAGFAPNLCITADTRGESTMSWITKPPGGTRASVRTTKKTAAGSTRQSSPCMQALDVHPAPARCRCARHALLPPGWVSPFMCSVACLYTCAPAAALPPDPPQPVWHAFRTPCTTTPRTAAGMRTVMSTRASGRMAKDMAAGNTRQSPSCIQPLHVHSASCPCARDALLPRPRGFCLCTTCACVHTGAPSAALPRDTPSPFGMPCPPLALPHHALP